MALNLRTIHWLASYPKSGNTWIRLLWQVYRTGCADINANLKLSLSDSMIAPAQQVSAFALEDLGRDTKMLLRPAALLYLVSQMGSPPLIVKTHVANVTVNSVGMIPKELTKSITYLIRDPRAVAVSVAKHYDMTIDQAIKMMADDGCMIGSDKDPTQFLSSWSAHVESWEKSDGIILRYEDIQANPGFAFYMILKQWGIDPDESLVKEAVEKTTLEEFKKQEGLNGFIEQGKGTFFNGSSWEGVLTDEQRKKIEDDHREVMVRYKYL